MSSPILLATISYYDLTNTIPDVKTLLHIYPYITWLTPQNENTSKQVNRSELPFPATEVVYTLNTYTSLSRYKYNDLLQTLKTRLDAFDYVYALGDCYNEKKIVVAFGESYPTDFELQLLVSDGDISIRLGMSETIYKRFNNSSRNTTDKKEYISISPNESKKEFSVDFSKSHKDSIHDLSSQAVETKKPIIVLINGYPLGTVNPKKVINNGILNIDTTLLDWSQRNCLTGLLSAIDEKALPEKLSIEDIYILENDNINIPRYKKSAYNKYTEVLMKKLSGTVPRLFRVMANNHLYYYLKTSQTENITQSYIKDINAILKSYPYTISPFTEICFCLCDEDETILYKVFIQTLPDTIISKSPPKVWIYSISSGSERIAFYSDELSHVCDEGVIKYD